MNKEIKMKKVMAPSSIIVVLLLLLVTAQSNASTTTLLFGSVDILEQVNPVDWRVGIRNNLIVTHIYNNVLEVWSTNLRIAKDSCFYVLMEIQPNPNNGNLHILHVWVCRDRSPNGGYAPPPGFECKYENQVPWE